MLYYLFVFGILFMFGIISFFIARNNCVKVQKIQMADNKNLDNTDVVIDEAICENLELVNLWD